VFRHGLRSQLPTVGGQGTRLPQPSARRAAFCSKTRRLYQAESRSTILTNAGESSACVTGTAPARDTEARRASAGSTVLPGRPRRRPRSWRLRLMIRPTATLGCSTAVSFRHASGTNLLPMEIRFCCTPRRIGGSQDPMCARRAVRSSARPEHSGHRRGVPPRGNRLKSHPTTGDGANLDNMCTPV